MTQNDILIIIIALQPLIWIAAIIYVKNTDKIGKPSKRHREWIKKADEYFEVSSSNSNDRHRRRTLVQNKDY